VLNARLAGLMTQEEERCRERYRERYRDRYKLQCVPSELYVPRMGRYVDGMILPT
jgi:hypothetical protein